MTKTVAQHINDGTYRADRHKNKGVSVAEPLPLAPDWLNEMAMMEWDRIVDVMQSANTEMLAATDYMVLATYCTLAAEFQEDPAGMMTTRIGLLSKIMNDLCLTPSARNRQRIPDGGKKTQVSKFDGIDS